MLKKYILNNKKEIEPIDLNINIQENANQYHNETPLHTH